jgi:hypothetical protein
MKGQLERKGIEKRLRGTSANLSDENADNDSINHELYQDICKDGASPEMKVVASSHNEQTTTVTSESWIPANISGKNYSIFCSV